MYISYVAASALGAKRLAQSTPASSFKGATPSTIMSARVRAKSDLKMFFRFVFMFFASVLFFTAVPFYTLVVGCGSIYFVRTSRADDIRPYRITLSEAKQPLSLGFANPAPLQGSLWRCDFVRFIRRRNFFKYIIALLFFLSTEMERNAFKAV